MSHSAKINGRKPSRVTADTSNTGQPRSAISSRTKSASSRASGTSILLSTTARGRSARSPSVESPCSVGVYAASSASSASMSEIGSRPGSMRGAVDDVHQHRAALDVPQEIQAQAAALGRAGDQPGHVGDGEGVLPRRHHTEVGHQRGERVVGDLRLGRRDHRHQRRLARRREADQPDVGDGLEFEGEVACLARLAEQREPGRLAGPGRQRGVAEPAAAAGGGLEAGARADQVGEQPAVLVEHDGAVGNLELQVGARGAVAVAARRPACPTGASTCGWKWKSSRVCTCGSTTSTMLPPRPPLPPSGPPSGLNFSRWTEAQPCPPLPARAWMTTRSTNRGIGIPFSESRQGELSASADSRALSRAAQASARCGRC